MENILADKDATLQKEQGESEGKNASVFNQMAPCDHEQVVHCYDSTTGLKAIVAIHSTALGPAMGGTRMWNYASDEEALTDAIRLARGMTYKSAISGLNVGGGKAVLIGDPKKLKNEAYLRRFGKFIDGLGGKYVTAGDVNMTLSDLEYVRMETRHVTGLPEAIGGSGSSSLVTAYGVYMGMKAAAKEAFGTDSLEGKKVAVQGVGAVGSKLTEYLTKEKAIVFAADISEDKLQRVSREFGAHVVSLDGIYDILADIYAPCALGATLNDDTISRLSCQVIAGGANNQLANEQRHGAVLRKRGVVYAPDFLVNAGGIMAVAAEYFGTYSKEYLFQKAERIYDVCQAVLQQAAQQQTEPHRIAMKMAEDRIASISQL
ncbi:Glu/Leu/Phe/Val family dehydrogenase [Tunicatimonas pelagia]|uniref:Glu/Leu/Phe/Val family dehydrogenase n=1 Tax=Tunicatimonas pelagia TaxID=931531 RepID=UPI002665B9CA|nr:Glu/Leu/Phe/Val dehydrogenase dimerization domain-containing protein [Tunicatimonas pelagia]WKN45554.1 Glu/Leu/Phe/Val dehydrogenase dimerization domain-containing protein [Tunicatimonas pelagia]